jgi:hypothetical protein
MRHASGYGYLVRIARDAIAGYLLPDNQMYLGWSFLMIIEAYKIGSNDLFW